MKTGILFALVGVSLIGCGSSIKKLTDEQRATFHQTAESMGLAMKSADPKGTLQVVAKAALIETPVRSSEQIQKQMASTILASCEIRPTKKVLTSKGEGIPGLPGNLKIGLTVTGGGCPVSLNYLVTTDFDAASGRMTSLVDLDYQVLSKEFKTMNDITSLAMKGGLTMAKNDVGTGGIGTIHVMGSLTSTKYGILPVSYKGSLSGAKGPLRRETVFRITYPEGVVVELKAVTTGNGQNVLSEHFLNGELLQEWEYQDLLRKSGGFIEPVKSDTKKP